MPVRIGWICRDRYNGLKWICRKFLPETGPEFFARCGWEPEQIHSVMHAAAKIKRLPLFLRLIAMISPVRFQPNRPWSGVCLMGRRVLELRPPTQADQAPTN